VPGEPAPQEAVATLDAAVHVARSRLEEDRQETLDVVRDLLLGREAGTAGRINEKARAELIVRFQQTCGPVMAKGVEDTAFYRWYRLASLNEVGGDPTRLGVSPEEFHSFAARLARDWPTTMTALSTHDTKRSEDTRAALAVLSEVPGLWAEQVRQWRELAATHRSPLVDGSTEYLVWQTLVGTWTPRGPISVQRLGEYLLKSVREAKQHTSWTNPNTEYEEAVAAFATGVLGDTELMAAVASFVQRTQSATRVAVLGQKLVQLTMPGVPDVYQGTEIVERSLVDPDNRRPVDYAERAARLERLDGGARPADLDDEKLLLVSRALRVRRERTGVFVGPEATYMPLPTSSGHALAFARGDASGAGVVTVAARLPVTLHRLGGWGDHTVALPDGTWEDLLTGRSFTGGAVRLADLLDQLPVALLALRRE
jgi:(1->4)-alpha-D-glucan 1-alpha-D-glucosylmutase